MQTGYKDVATRFLRADERLILSDEIEMPLVLEAKKDSRVSFLQHFLHENSESILNNIATYGAVLLRGFDITSDHDFEQTVLSINGLQGISEAFMSEEGRTHVDDLKFVLHTNTVYKTGGTLYLGGFHTENYYNPDVPSYISFCCLQPSTLGGETGLISTEKVYQHFSQDLQSRLEKQSFFVGKWLVSEVTKRYQITVEEVEKICKKFDLPLIGEGKHQFIVMYKPSVLIHPVTKKRSLQVNLFEILPLNRELRKCFMHDYQGKTWFWHRFVWKLPKSIFKLIEKIYIMFASFFHSPSESLSILQGKIKTYLAEKKVSQLTALKKKKVGTCFTKQEVKELAKSMRQYYCSFLWKKGDILIVDNRKVMHAGMPGAGPRKIRALICNPIEIKYSSQEPGVIQCENRLMGSVGEHMQVGDPQQCKYTLLEQ